MRAAAQYGVQQRIMDLCTFDVTRNPWRCGELFDAIITDPPCKRQTSVKFQLADAIPDGVRAGAKRLGRKTPLARPSQQYVANRQYVVGVSPSSLAQNQPNLQRRPAVHPTNEALRAVSAGVRPRPARAVSAETRRTAGGMSIIEPVVSISADGEVWGFGEADRADSWGCQVSCRGGRRSAFCLRVDVHGRESDGAQRRPGEFGNNGDTDGEGEGYEDSEDQS